MCRELEGNTVPHQTGPNDGYAFDVVRAHRRSHLLRAVQRLTLAEMTRHSHGEFEKSAPETGFVLRGQVVGISILTLSQRLYRRGVSHYDPVRHRTPDRNAPPR
jgi:hypothetical protein